MIIRSQSKKIIVNMDNVDSICVNEDGDVNAYNGVYGSKTFLGEYSTEEKAIKVLDMIQDAYQKETQGKFEYNADVVYCVPRNTVFQMPQDSEV